jgi:SAM-dependent methyltransferase
MTTASDYRESHQAQEKGRSYESDFEELKYRRYMWSWEQQVLGDILERFFSAGQRIRYLDFACGTGRITRFLEGRVAISYGVDVSDSMLDVARRTLVKTKLIKADITESDPLAGETFDLITAFRFFLNAQEELREKVMMALAKRLDRRGSLVLNVHMNHSCVLARLVRTKRRLLRRDPYALTTLSTERIGQLADRCGLRIVRTYHRGVVPIVNENTPIPLWMIHPLESFASRVPAMRSWARYVVYVCQHRGDGVTG